MIKLVILLARQAGLSEDAFHTRLADVHMPLVRRLPGLKRTALHRVLPGTNGQASDWDHIAEDWFESPKALEAALASPEGQALNADAASFLDLSKLQFVILEQEHAEELSSPLLSDPAWDRTRK